MTFEEGFSPHRPSVVTSEVGAGLNVMGAQDFLNVILKAFCKQQRLRFDQAVVFFFLVHALTYL